MRALETGRSFPSMLAGTWVSQVSSSVESLALLEEYQEPAWLAFLVDIVGTMEFYGGVLGVRSEKLVCC